MTPDEEPNAVEQAYTNALIYGIGLVKMMNTPEGVVLSIVDPKEYLELAQSLEYVAKNSMYFPPPKTSG